jgi:hypothetical protein
MHNQHMHRKVNKTYIHFCRYYRHGGLTCSKGKELESMVIHEVISQAPMQHPPFLVEHLLRRWTYML